MKQLTEMTDVELKAAAYERQRNIEMAQKFMDENRSDLQLIEFELRRRASSPRQQPGAPAESEKKEEGV